MPNHLAGPDGPERRNKPTELRAVGPHSTRGPAPETQRLVAGDGRAGPPVPFVMPRDLRTLWDGIWCSPLAQILDPVTDYPAMARLFRSYHLLYRIDRAILNAGPARRRELEQLFSVPVRSWQEEQRVVELAAAFEDLPANLALRLKYATECRQQEQQLGLSPRARLGLGVMLKAATSPAGGNSADEFDFDDDDDDD